MQPDTQDNPALSANEIELSEQERAALAERDAQATTATTEGAATEGDTTGAPAQAGESAPEGNPPAAAEAGEAPANEEIAGAVQATEPPPAPFAPTYAVESRDFAAEIAGVNKQLTDLKARYKAGDFEDDDDAYETQYEALRDQRSQIERAQDLAQLTEQINRQNADQSWAYLQRQFLSMPENASIGGNGLLFAAWEQGMQLVVNEAHAAGKTLTDWDILNGARQKLVEAGMLQAAAAAAAPAQAAPPAPAKPDRQPPLKDVPAGLSSAPAAADPGARPAVDTMTGDSIEDLEQRMAAMSEAQRDELLKQVPGSIVSDT